MKDKENFAYAEPKVEVITLDSSDVIQTSNPSKVLTDAKFKLNAIGWDDNWRTLLTGM